jgi:hypothetical protein
MAGDSKANAKSQAKRGDAPAQGRDFISENLRALFGDAEKEALPDRFRELLDKLAAEERK